MKTMRIREAFALDFEFHAPDGHRPRVICMVARELGGSGRVIRLDGDELYRRREAPFNTGPDSLVVAYYATAELGCFLELGWALPVNVVDLYVEFRNATNGRSRPHGCGLLGALAWYGLPPVDSFEKEAMRTLAMRGGPFTPTEMSALIDYCESDVDAVAALWKAMEPQIDNHSLLRGRYLKAAAHMERTGIPIDSPMLAKLNDRWSLLQDRFRKEADPAGEIWIDGHFSQQAFSLWLQKFGIVWPRLDTGQLSLSNRTFSDMAKIHPVLQPLHQIRQTLSCLKALGIVVGPDGRNRTLLSPFGSLSGRNQPSTTRFAFGPASWLRRLIRPEEGMALAYMDWCQQEFGISGCLSGDMAMQDAYLSSDPYLAFAMRAGAAPPNATKKSHEAIRDAFKTVVLGVGYGMSAFGLSAKLGVHLAEAEAMLEMHRRCYSTFWKWSQGASDYAQLSGAIHTRFGWRLHLTPNTKDRTIRNFPAQGNGAEMMRLAAIDAVEAGIRVCAPVHDAFLIESTIENIEHDVARMRACMARASANVLGGFRLQSDAEIIRFPSRFGEDKHSRLWNVAMEVVNQ